jgi:predicted nucleotidyltransferase component of viral defense system
MDKIIAASTKERRKVFEQAGSLLGFSPAIVEKDFWVTWVLGQLFESKNLKHKLLFKGGTSLSKVFNLIQRFSEDIDLILDWNEVVTVDPRLERSKTKQDHINKQIPLQAQGYIKQVLLPEIKELISEICEVKIEVSDPNVININYPATFEDGYLRPEIRLEIGPLASWTPNDDYEISSFLSQVLPNVIHKATVKVKAIKVERTFWEKATILHHEANRPLDQVFPSRYSRHYYDMYKLISNQAIQDNALADLNLLKSVVQFKEKFYPRAWAAYGQARPGSFKIIPPIERVESLKQDYKNMSEMLYGDIPTFSEIIKKLEEFEINLNSSNNNKLKLRGDERYEL